MDVLVIFFSAIFSQIPQEKRKKTRFNKEKKEKYGEKRGVNSRFAGSRSMGAITFCSKSDFRQLAIRNYLKLYRNLPRREGQVTSEQLVYFGECQFT